MAGTADSDAQQLYDQGAAAKEQAHQLARRSAELAGQIADTELDVARVQDAIAENGATSIWDQAREHAEEARRFASHEQKQEQTEEPLTAT